MIDFYYNSDQYSIIIDYSSSLYPPCDMSVLKVAPYSQHHIFKGGA